MAGWALRASARDVLLTLAAICALRGVARAGDVDVARRLFDDGVKLFQRGDYEGARRLFKQAETEHHAARIVYNLALAEERLGHPQAAVDAYESYLAEVGDQDELAPAAAVAVAQLKTRSTRLRIESKPAGARVFVDGTPLPEPAPTTYLVPPGRHVVVAHGDAWRAERDVEAKGTGDVLPVSVEPAREAEPSAGAATAPASSPPPSVREEVSDGLVWGASFAIAPYYLFGVANASASNARDARAVVAGPVLEVGHAIDERFLFLARGFAALGPDGKPTYAYMGGPGIAVRVARPLWVSATFLGGRLETEAHGVRYGTDLVFGAMAEVSVVVARTRSGEWLASAQPGALLTELRNDNTLLFVALAFGYRAF